MALIEKLRAIADAIREKTGGTEEMTLTEMAEAVAGISVGENLPEAELVSFSADQLDPDARYSIGHNWFARLVERVQGLTNQTANYTPEEIIYWLGRVTYLPQGFASSEVYTRAFTFESNAVGELQEG